MHECTDSLADSAEVMVVHLLPLRRHGADQGTACIYEILSLEELLPVYDEIFLLSTNRWCDLVGSRIAKEPQESESLLIDGFHRTEQRRLLVESLACV